MALSSLSSYQLPEGFAFAADLSSVLLVSECLQDLPDFHLDTFL